MTEEISKMAQGKQIKIDIQEIKTPELDAQLVARPDLPGHEPQEGLPLRRLKYRHRLWNGAGLLANGSSYDALPDGNRSGRGHHGAYPKNGQNPSTQMHLRVYSAVSHSNLSAICSAESEQPYSSSIHADRLEAASD